MGFHGEAVTFYADNEDLVQKAEQRLEEARQATGETDVMVSHSLLQAHLYPGRNARAEEHFAEMMRLPVQNLYGQVIRDHSQACIALRAYGNLDEAKRLLSQCLEDCIRHRYMWFVGMLRGQLAECRRRQETVRQRGGTDHFTPIRFGYPTHRPLRRTDHRIRRYLLQRSLFAQEGQKTRRRR